MDVMKVGYALNGYVVRDCELFNKNFIEMLSHGHNESRICTEWIGCKVL